MKLGPLTIGRTAQAATIDATLAVPKAKPLREQGSSGTINLGGFLEQGEYNNDLRGLNGLDAYRRMADSDGSTQEALQHIMAPIMNATWEVDPSGEEPEAQEIAEAVRCSLMEWPTQPFHDFLGEALECLTFGHSVFEPVWEAQDHSLEYEDTSSTKPKPGEAKPVADPADSTVQTPVRQWLTLRRMAPRMQHTIWRWVVDNTAGGDLVAIEQQAYRNGEYQIITIPADRLVVFTFRKRGDDWTGKSILRAAYKHWVFKELIEKIEAVALERHGVGTWVAYVPESRRNDEDLQRSIETILADIRAGTRPYIVAPGPKWAPTSDNGFSFEIVSPTGTAPDFKTAKEYHRGEIKGSMLVRFAELGHSSVGARATGDTQSKIWYDALEAAAGFIADVINQQYVRRFVDFNYGPQDEYPRLVARGIQARSLDEFATSHAKLLAAGGIDADQSYRAFVREEMGAPAEDDPEASDGQEPSDLLNPADPMNPKNPGVPPADPAKIEAE